jgi:hypothetical protein
MVTGFSINAFYGSEDKMEEREMKGQKRKAPKG